MFTRREIVTHAPAGVFAAALPAPAEAAPSPQDNSDVVQELRRFEQIVQKPLTAAFESNTLAFGHVPKLRDLYTAFLKANNKFPDFCDIGVGVFYDVYDWHVKHKEPLLVGRTADNKLTIKFMYTTLIVRVDTDSTYFGFPFDQR